jgi:heat-inducible transcriptional repressor
VSELNLVSRKREILRAVVDQYVETAEPVGSKSVALRLKLSPATIRNEMAELESQGFLEQPHTSAGRVPTALGYRLYVNELMRRHKLTISETEELNAALRSRVSELDRLIAYAGQIASRMTSFPAYAALRAATGVTISRIDIIQVDPRSFIIVALLSSDTAKNKLVHMPSPLPDGLLTKACAVLNSSFTGISEDKITDALLNSCARAMGDTFGVTAIAAQFALELLCETETQDFAVAGESRLLEHPEYHDVDKARRLLRYLSREEETPALPAPDAGAAAKITIGPENPAEPLRDSSVIVTRYDLSDGAELLIGVVGPTRMDYSRVLSRLEYLARGIAGTGLSPPGGARSAENDSDDP